MSRIDDASQEADFTAVREEMTVAVTSAPAQAFAEAVKIALGGDE